jgi:hypothetical protein
VSLKPDKRLKELEVKQESYFKWVGNYIWDTTQQGDYETRDTLSRDTWIADSLSPSYQNCCPHIGWGLDHGVGHPLPLLHPDTIRPLDCSLGLKAGHRAEYDSPECRHRQGDAYVERCAGLVHRSRPLSNRHSHRHASCGTFCRPCVGAWMDLAPQMLALVDTIPPPYPPEDTQHLAHETASAHE